MKKTLHKNTYSQLVKDITELYDYARFAYWQIGSRIVEHEQQGDGKAEYGVRLLEHLSEDLQRKLGSGFPKRNPYRMRESCLAYSILPAPAKLNSDPKHPPVADQAPSTVGHIQAIGSVPFSG
jgi:hypothetical protein